MAAEGANQEQASSDFSAFYSAGRIVSAGHGGQLYDLGVQREAQRIFSEKFGRPPLLPFNHPPFEALIFAPLSLLPYGMAFVVWMSCNIAMSIGAIFLVRPYLQSLQNSFDLALIATSFFAPLLVAISQGQDSIILLFLFALCLVSLLRGREGLAGCTLALAMFKPQLALPAMLMLTLAHERWRRLLAGFFSTCIALSLVSVGVVGWRAFINYPAVLVQSVPENPGVINPGDMPNCGACSMQFWGSEYQANLVSVYRGIFRSSYGHGHRGLAERLWGQRFTPTEFCTGGDGDSPCRFPR